MLIAFCTSGAGPDAPLSDRFGRSDYFLIFNTDSSELRSIANSAKNAAGGAGASAVQQLVDNDVEILIAPEVGPQAHDALKQFSIRAYRQGSAHSMPEALDAFRQKILQEFENPTVKGLHRA